MDAITPDEEQPSRNDVQLPEPQSTTCREYKDRFLRDTFEEIKNERDLMDRFLQDDEEETPSWSTDVITQFRRSKRSSDPEKSPEIKLDDCDHGTNKSRFYPETLTPIELRQVLSVDRFGVKGKPNADRRKIRINRIDPDSLLAVAETSHCHQVESLRDTFTNHISQKTSFEVVEPANGFIRTRLELNIPYLALRTIPGSSVHPASDVESSSLTPWSKLPFLTRNILAEHVSRQSVPVIYQGHVSILLCNWDDTKWTAYVFFKPVPPHVSDQEQDGGGENGDEDEDDDDDVELDARSDILAPDGPYHNLEDIWNFKIYFLRISAMWITRVLKEYERLVRTLEDSAQNWVWIYCPFAKCR